jgi:CMP-N-acetylneuraminic acid synthetase
MHVADLIPFGLVLWTHVTSPFADEQVYADAIAAYFAHQGEGLCDSLVSANRLQTFIWDSSGPVNYDRCLEKWPRTQTLPLWYELNSAIFLAPAETYRERHDRIGSRPFVYELEFPACVDVDTESGFRLAEGIWSHAQNA